MTVLKNYNIKKPKLGAFEVIYMGKCLFSKITTTLTPVPLALVQRLKMFIDDVKKGGDLSKYDKIKDVKYVPPKPFKSSYK